jgi:hypothetical protein
MSNTTSIYRSDVVMSLPCNTIECKAPATVATAPGNGRTEMESDMPDDTAEQLELLLPETKRTRDKSDDELTPRQLYLRNWWRNHRDYSRQRRAEYRANNLEAVRASNRDWNRRNKDRLTISNARYAASPKGRYMTLINNAKLGGHELALTFDEWFEIASQDCTYWRRNGTDRPVWLWHRQDRFFKGVHKGKLSPMLLVVQRHEE